MHHWQVKVCKTCAHWSEATKGQCTLDSRACGQFWRCDDWEGAGSDCRERSAG
jgi:hypothetical protein